MTAFVVSVQAYCRRAGAASLFFAMRTALVRCEAGGAVAVLVAFTPVALHVTRARAIVLHATVWRCDMVAKGVNERVRKHRRGLRRAGLRPVQIWVPDTRRPGFEAECRRQSRLVARADARDGRLQHIMDSAAADMDSWTA